jgi:hypothetical protein
LAPVAAASLLALVALAAIPVAHAAEIDTGTPDLTLRWDNTLRYNFGVRTQGQDPAILANPNYDDGDRNFNKGKVVANRVDLLSEADIVWQKKIGARASVALWADDAYSSLSNTNNATANTLINGVPTAGSLSPYTKRYAKGVSGELLDAFVFANTEIGDMPVSVRAGKHTVFWGEGLLGGSAIHGISYGQYSLDLWKAYATPGIELKELFRPRNSITVQAQPTTELSIAAQAFFDWESVRVPESGSYLTIQDGLLHGGESLIVGPNQRLLMSAGGTPKKTGDFGLAARWSPAWLDGTAGLYARRTADIQPQLAATPAAAAIPLAACQPPGAPPSGHFLGAPQANGSVLCYINPAAASLAQLQSGFVGQYSAYYGRDIDIYGLSLSKNVLGVSVGAELSVRHNMPLQSIAVNVLPGPLAAASPGALSIAQLAALNGDAPGARGNTAHGVLTLLGIVNKTPLFDTMNWQMEAVWSRWLSVTSNAAAFKGGDAYRANPVNIDAVSKDYVGLAINVTPTWFQVFPSVDLSMPLSWSGGLSGNSAVLNGGNAGAGNFSLGVSADIQSKYSLALRYVGFYGKYNKLANGMMNVADGTAAALSDRGHALLTFKTTF